MRYFIVSYRATAKELSSVIGLEACIINNGYLNGVEFQKSTCDKLGFRKVIITNITELNESDYNDFIRE